MKTDKEKQKLRKYIKTLKNAYSSDELKVMSQPVMKQVEQLDAFKAARCILAYWSLPDEVNTHYFVQRWSGKKQMVLPKVEGESLELRLFEGEDLLCKGSAFGIPEPAGPLVTDFSRIDLVVVPGVAFTNQGERLGRGGGYYDRILPRLEEAFKVGVAFPFQLQASLPVAGYDVKMDKVLIGEIKNPLY